MKIINLTPHTVRLADEAGNIIAEYDPSGDVARLIHKQGLYIKEDTDMGIPVCRYQPFSEAYFEGLPLDHPPAESNPETRYIVSLLCLESAHKRFRHDVYAPDTGPNSGVIRKDGQVYAVRRLVQSYTPVYR